MEARLLTVYSINEAAFLTEMSTAAINRAIDRREIETSRDVRDANGSRRLDRAGLRTLAVIGAVGRDLAPAGRRRVSTAIRRLPAGARRVDLGIMEVVLDDLDKRLTERASCLEALRQLVEPRDAGDPVIRGTSYSVYAVAAFSRGMTTDEIVRNCPGLTPKVIERAVEYADVYPRAGRPLPTKSLKAVLSDMATSGVWNVETEEPLVP